MEEPCFSLQDDYLEGSRNLCAGVVASEGREIWFPEFDVCVDLVRTDIPYETCDFETFLRIKFFLLVVLFLQVVVAELRLTNSSYTCKKSVLQIFLFSNLLQDSSTRSPGSSLKMILSPSST